ncbi:MAG: hypothetical protein LZF85_13765 [Nitrosomonas sp.]|uniref:hypothetical protein n=1 Tax=Nitrosomonas sp. TaxID=42353 RepID=UPI0025FB9C0D|nr:hypothetical protein [Nitrosomonas sp.]UJP02801.1 MAG: hypothetical protein LZF85_13765 [Nitrosomonas sp.]
MRTKTLIALIIILLIGCTTKETESMKFPHHNSLPISERKYCDEGNPECKRAKLDEGTIRKLREISGLEDIALVAAIDVNGEIVLLEYLEKYRGKDGKEKIIEKRNKSDVEANGPIINITATPNKGSQCLLWAYNKTSSSGTNYSNYCLWWNN